MCPASLPASKVSAIRALEVGGGRLEGRVAETVGSVAVGGAGDVLFLVALAVAGGVEDPVVVVDDEHPAMATRISVATIHLLGCGMRASLREAERRTQDEANAPALADAFIIDAGAGEGIRTLDLLFTKQLLYH